MNGWRRMRFTIQQPTVTRDATYGSAVKTWAPLEVVAGTSPEEAVKYWGEVRDALPSRSEAVRTGLDQARNQTVLRMRWRDDVTSAMRVILHGETEVLYQIVGGPAEVEGRKKMLEMVLERYSTSGETV